jgi:hypothetical protein
MVWSNKVGDGKTTKCVQKRSMSNIYIGEGVSSPWRGAAKLLPLFLFMVVVTPSFMER